MLKLLFDLAKNSIAFESVTLLETLKLFKYVFWYSAADPRLDLLNIVTEKYNQAGGKIAFSMTFQDSTGEYPYDISSLQGFLPIDAISAPLGVFGTILPGAEVRPAATNDFPILRTVGSIQYVRSLTENNIIAENIYDLFDRDGIRLGNVAFRTRTKNLFFIGMPLNQCNGGQANVSVLLTKIFFEDFGVTP